MTAQWCSGQQCYLTGCWFKSFCVESLHVCVASLFFPQSKVMQVSRFTVDFKLNECLSLCVSHVMNWQLVHSVSWDQPQPPDRALILMTLISLYHNTLAPSLAV